MDETPVSQSKVIFFCTVPELAMKNTLLDQMQLMAVTALGRMVRCTLVQGGRAITKLRMSALDTSSNSHTMLRVLCCEVVRSYTPCI